MKRLLRKLSPFSPGFFSLSMPFYVTRPHGARGETASYSMSLWMSTLATVLIWGNVVLWSVVGLIKGFSILL